MNGVAKVRYKQNSCFVKFKNSQFIVKINNFRRSIE